MAKAKTDAKTKQEKRFTREEATKILDRLTPRQLETFKLTVRGYNRSEISESCGITISTVDSLMSDIRMKFSLCGLRTSLDWWKLYVPVYYETPAQ